MDAAAFGVCICVTPRPGGISNKAVPLESVKLRVFGKNRKTVRSPIRAKVPSLKRKSAREERPVANPSPGTIASDVRALRTGRFFGNSCTKLRMFWIKALVKGVSALALSLSTGSAIKPHNTIAINGRDLRDIACGIRWRNWSRGSKIRFFAFSGL